MGSRSPRHSARSCPSCVSAAAIASSGSYGMPIWASRSGSAEPSATVIRPGARSSSALTVIAVSATGRAYVLSAPSATRMSGTAAAMAVAYVTASRSK